MLHRDSSFLFLRRSDYTFQPRLGVVRAAPGSRQRSVAPYIPECYVCGVVAPLIYVCTPLYIRFHESRTAQVEKGGNHFLLLKLLVCFSKHGGVAGNHGN